MASRFGLHAGEAAVGEAGGYCGDMRDTRRGTTEMSGMSRKPGRWKAGSGYS
jgi:hypothetical protein